MRHRSLWAAFAAFVLLFAPGPKASAATSFSFSLRIGDPYIGPRLAFYEQPDVVLIPGTRVYYVDDYDYDLYRYGNYWYYCWNGGWYRSVDYDGPFYFIGYQSVPYSIRYIPVRYRHHWRNYRGAAYSHYSAGRYYPSNPASYTYYRTRYENRYPRTRGQFSVQENRTRQRQQPVQYRQERAPQREQYRQQPVPQRAREQVRQQQPPQREQVRQRGQGSQRQQQPQDQQNRGDQGKRGKGNQKGQDENRGQGGGHGRGHN
ncbi:MAG TPA: hypothetical protein VFX78_02420 [Candidatus Eisenbacteria bacterium]|nr:hypothetical protein [Candidatus Eisenbacteria bacterium]